MFQDYCRTRIDNSDDDYSCENQVRLAEEGWWYWLMVVWMKSLVPDLSVRSIHR